MENMAASSSMYDTADILMEELDFGGEFLSDDDEVVQEIDVFLSPHIDASTKLYLLQYPLRPEWRPYKLEERCQEVRVKANQQRMEVDLAIDSSADTFDRDAPEALQVTTQTLTSSKLPLDSSYAIGVLKGNQLHLNPLHSVVQLRPSLAYLDQSEENAKKSAAAAAAAAEAADEEMADDDGGEEEKLVAVQVNIRRKETDEQEQSRLQSYEYFRKTDETDPWIPVQPYAISSEESREIMQKMCSVSDTVIPFSLTQAEYIDALTPGRIGFIPVAAQTSGEPSEGVGTAGLSRSFLDTLPLDEKIRTILSKGKVQVFHLSRIMQMLPEGSEESQVVPVLEQNAMMVQGCWVTASSRKYQMPLVVVRDFFLLHFTKKAAMAKEDIARLKVPREMVKEILSGIARHVGSGATGGWHFYEPRDDDFLQRYPEIAARQQKKWAAAEPALTAAALSLNVSAVGSSQPLKGGNVAAKSGGGAEKRALGAAFRAKGGDAPPANGAEGAGSEPINAGPTTSMSAATRAALPAALREIFARHHVLNLQFLLQCLRELPIMYSSDLNANPRQVQAAMAASRAASAPLHELQSELQKVATCIHGSYVLTSTGDALNDPIRNLIIALLIQKGPNGPGFRRTEVEKALKVISADAQLTLPVFQKAAKDICRNRGTVWFLKEGDGRPN